MQSRDKALGSPQLLWHKWACSDSKPSLGYFFVCIVEFGVLSQLQIKENGRRAGPEKDACLRLPDPSLWNGRGVDDIVPKTVTWQMWRQCLVMPIIYRSDGYQCTLEKSRFFVAHSGSPSSFCCVGAQPRECLPWLHSIFAEASPLLVVYPPNHAMESARARNRRCARV